MTAKTMPSDLTWMQQALALARRGEGHTRPNPPVGAVLVKNGRRIGQGWHRRAGGPHAEIYAMRQAGEQARGAPLYVTLEPCSTHGRPPPCVDAILQAGIRRVVVAAIDPNPSHAGRGIRCCAGMALTW
jgi:diaminohydroxyphosphoribosylaminopyrimidine deaminase/5-amino-6-(5-phosphoribosylamino)uracil reductase